MTQTLTRPEAAHEAASAVPAPVRSTVVRNAIALMVSTGVHSSVAVCHWGEVRPGLPLDLLVVGVVVHGRRRVLPVPPVVPDDVQLRRPLPGARPEQDRVGDADPRSIRKRTSNRPYRWEKTLWLDTPPVA
jgi:hypothetical protein